MMDMLMSREAVMLLGFLILLVGLVFVAVRVLGARAVRGDHPHEKGYDHDLYFAASSATIPWNWVIPGGLLAILYAFTRSRRNRMHATPA